MRETRTPMRNQPLNRNLEWAESPKGAGLGASPYFCSGHAGTSNSLKQCGQLRNHSSVIWLTDCCVGGRKREEGI
jgi:hypothetical protein